MLTIFFPCCAGIESNMGQKLLVQARQKTSQVKNAQTCAIRVWLVMSTNLARTYITSTTATCLFFYSFYFLFITSILQGTFINRPQNTRSLLPGHPHKLWVGLGVPRRAEHELETSGPRPWASSSRISASEIVDAEKSQPMWANSGGKRVMMSIESFKIQEEQSYSGQAVQRHGKV